MDDSYSRCTETVKFIQVRLGSSKGSRSESHRGLNLCDSVNPLSLSWENFNHKSRKFLSPEANVKYMYAYIHKRVESQHCRWTNRHTREWKKWVVHFQVFQQIMRLLCYHMLNTTEDIILQTYHHCTFCFRTQILYWTWSGKPKPKCNMYLKSELHLILCLKLTIECHPFLRQDPTRTVVLSISVNIYFICD